MSKLSRIKYGLLLVLVIGFICIAPLSAFSQLQTKLLINDEEVEVKQPYSIFIKEGHVYVPLRLIAKQIGLNIAYDKKNKEVSITKEDMPPTKIKNFSSRVFHTTKYKDFELFIGGNNNQFKSSETIDAWSSLRYSGESNVTVERNSTFLAYYLEDETGFRIQENESADQMIEDYTPGRQHMKILPENVKTIFLLEKFAIDPEDYVNGKVELPPLPKGKYRLGVTARFKVDDVMKLLSSEIEISIIN